MATHNKKNIFPGIIFILAGLFGLFAELLFIGEKTGFISFAKTNKNIVRVTGRVEKVSPCVNKILCFRIVVQSDTKGPSSSQGSWGNVKTSYYIVSFPPARKVFSLSCLTNDKSKCPGNPQSINLNDYVGKEVTVKGILSSHNQTPYIHVKTISENQSCNFFGGLCGTGLSGKLLGTCCNGFICKESGLPDAGGTCVMNQNIQCDNQPDGAVCQMTECICPINSPDCAAPCSLTNGICQNQTCTPLPPPPPGKCVCPGGDACPDNDMNLCAKSIPPPPDWNTGK